MDKLVLIDGHSILNRAFYGVPDLTNSEGLHTNAVYGFLNIMFKILEEEKADHLAVAFDLKEPTFRHKMYDAYKGTRKPMPEELREQVPLMKEVLTAMGVKIVEKAGLEADDILGTLSKRCEDAKMEVVIISGDRDLLQLATEHVEIRIPKTKRTGTEIENYYETITASIAIDFQANLEKAIEKWNIYLVFECRESIDWKIRLKVEQDKYAVRKVVWDDLKEEELNNKEYINKRLLCFEINENLERHKDRGDLIKRIEENDLELYKILQKKDLTLDEKVAMYVGDGINE